MLGEWTAVASVRRCGVLPGDSSRPVRGRAGQRGASSALPFDDEPDGPDRRRDGGGHDAAFTLIRSAPTGGRRHHGARVWNRDVVAFRSGQLPPDDGHPKLAAARYAMRAVRRPAAARRRGATATRERPVRSAPSLAGDEDVRMRACWQGNRGLCSVTIAPPRQESSSEPSSLAMRSRWSASSRLTSSKRLFTSRFILSGFSLWVSNRSLIRVA